LLQSQFIVVYSRKLKAHIPLLAAKRFVKIGEMEYELYGHCDLLVAFGQRLECLCWSTWMDECVLYV